MATWVVLVGSSRKNGRSAKAAAEFARWVAQKKPQVELEVFSIGQLDLEPCTGCNMCTKTYTCIKEDDANTVLEHVLAAERLVVFTPVYFAGLPAPFKALIDRFQPLFWKRADLKKAGQDLLVKRPASVVVFGEGNDPHGWEPAVVSLRSALALADFALADVQACIGRSAKPDYSALAEAAVLPVQAANSAHDAAQGAGE